MLTALWPEFIPQNSILARQHSGRILAPVICQNSGWNSGSILFWRARMLFWGILLLSVLAADFCSQQQKRGQQNDSAQNSGQSATQQKRGM